MLRLELLEQVHLLLIIAGGQAHLFLPLVEHHLLDHGARLAVQVAQLAVLRLDLARVDLGVVRQHVRPPFHLVDLVQVDRHFFGRGVCRSLKRPAAFVDVDRVWQRPFHYWLFAFDCHAELCFLDLNYKVSSFEVGGNRNRDVDILDGLCPLVWELTLLFLLFCANFGVELFTLCRCRRRISSHGEVDRIFNETSSAEYAEWFSLS